MLHVIDSIPVEILDFKKNKKKTIHIIHMNTETYTYSKIHTYSGIFKKKQLKLFAYK